jgi:hypothetical protein
MDRAVKAFKEIFKFRIGVTPDVEVMKIGELPRFEGNCRISWRYYDGIQNCFQYIDNFDPAISSNPFSYFTQIIYYAFLRRIEFESKQTYVKFKSFETHDLFTNHQYESKKHVNLIHSINKRKDPGHYHKV